MTERTTRIRRGTPKHRAVAALCAASLGLGTLATTTPAKAMGAIEIALAAYEVIQIVGDVLGLNSSHSAAPNIIAHIDDAKDEILDHITSTRNLEIKAQVGAALDKLKNLNNMQHPTQIGQFTWALTLNDYEDIQSHIELIVQDGDKESAYELAPAYTVLAALGALLHHAKREVDGIATPWQSYQDWLRSVVHTNYTLVKSLRHECSPGWNPGFYLDSTDRTFEYHFYTRTSGFWRESMLYEKIANKNFRTHKWEGGARPPNDPSGCEHVVYHHKCNPWTGVCTQPPEWCNPWAIPPDLTLQKCSSSMTDKQCAKYQAEQEFKNDIVVDIVSASQDRIMRLAGGNDHGPAADNNLYLFFGRVVDPWVPEPSCGTGRAYPQEPIVN